MNDNLIKCNKIQCSIVIFYSILLLLGAIICSHTRRTRCTYVFFIETYLVHKCLRCRYLHNIKYRNIIFRFTPCTYPSVYIPSIFALQKNYVFLNSVEAAIEIN